MNRFIKQVERPFIADEGILKGYANIYNVEDLQGDISAVGSFSKTVTERKKKIKIYRNHDSEQFVGVPLELDIADPIGLMLTAKMLMDTEAGKNAFLEAKFLVENGFESGFSIGGWVMKRDDKDLRIVKEYKLDEISILTREQANQGSMVELVKSLKDTPMKEVEFWKIIEKAYNEKFSDSILKSLEEHLTLREDPMKVSRPVEPLEFKIWRSLI